MMEPEAPTPNIIGLILLIIAGLFVLVLFIVHNAID
jgi:hypothetical protein